MKLQRQAMMKAMEIHMNQMKCNFILMGDGKIHPGQIAMMMTLKYLGPSSQRTLAKKMNCSPASIGVSVKRLEKAGLVEKQAVEQDLRATRVLLTAMGEKLADRSEKLVNLLSERKYAGFSESEMELLNQFLTRINDNLEAYQDELTNKRSEKAGRAAQTNEQDVGEEQKLNTRSHGRQEAAEHTPERAALRNERERMQRRERRSRKPERGMGDSRAESRRHKNRNTVAEGKRQ